MNVLAFTRSHPAIRAWTLTTLLAAGTGCATGPRIGFTGTWTAELPQGPAVLFYAKQVGSVISGTVSNFGPLMVGSTSAITGTVTPQGVTIKFSYPASFSGGTPGPAIAWTFHGAFTSATTIEGTITSATGISGSMVITKDNGPLPV